MEILDYESIETHLGDQLRHSDCLDIHADRFFPVTLLDLLFHYSEQQLGSEIDSDSRILHRNFHGHDFDRWIDNLVAKTKLKLVDEERNIETVELIDIDSVIFDSNSVFVNLPDETRYTLLNDHGSQFVASNLEQVGIHLDLASMFDHGPVDEDSEPYLGFGPLAHIIRVVCDKSGIDPARVKADELSQRIFNHFKNEMLPLIPSLWNDMEHILHYATPVIVNS